MYLTTYIFIENMIQSTIQINFIIMTHQRMRICVLGIG